MARRQPKGFSLGTLMDLASQAVTDITNSGNGMPRRILDELAPWIGSFTQSAAAKWLPYLSSAHPCKVPVIRSGVEFPCTNHAIGPCDACSRPACIHHAMVDQHGGIGCYLCMVEIMRQKRAAIPPPADNADRRPPVPPDIAEARVKRALDVLGIKRGTPWEEIEKKKRKLLAENHPDKRRSPEDKARAEARYKEIGSAFADLERFYKKKSEAAA